MLNGYAALHFRYYRVYSDIIYETGYLQQYQFHGHLQ